MPQRSSESSWFSRFKLEEFPQPECIKLRYPVFICHGYGAVASLVKPSPLHDVCMFMRSRGVMAVAPNIVPYAKIETRADRWASLIHRFVDQMHIDQVHVVAHSQGGLDMRYALAKTNVHEKVATLTTIATPHHGTELSNLALNAPDLLRKKMASFFNWMGDKMYPEISSDTLGSIRQLTPDYVQNTFNAEIQDVDSVRYFSISAAVGEGTNQPIAPVLRYQNRYIFDREGINDGFVSQRSAVWGHHLEQIGLSHVEQMNLNVSDKRKPRWENFYERLLRHLAEEGEQ
jgi:triacylglycerol lipase